MLNRLIKTVAVALALVAAALPAAGEPAPTTDAENRAPAASWRQAAAEQPSWLAWLRSIVLGEPSSPRLAPEPAGEGEDDEQDLGPSQDPDG